MSTGSRMQIHIYMAGALLAMWTVFPTGKVQCAEMDDEGHTSKVAQERRIIFHLTRTTTRPTRSFLEYVPQAQPWPPQAPRPREKR
ncbi:uncharacterized protein LOC142586904 isoform X2 [Dermacentor variabilis]|uniref:uncharacterized protein LOC142586904 isoform X2 n=1 Tax=Dermacentor variabilis TaxID=34621 RepID=UPI003F5BF91F